MPDKNEKHETKNKKNEHNSKSIKPQFQKKNTHDE
jgi:hypothetical protein